MTQHHCRQAYVGVPSNLVVTADQHGFALCVVERQPANFGGDVRPECVTTVSDPLSQIPSRRGLCWEPFESLGICTQVWCESHLCIPEVFSGYCTETCMIPSIRPFGFPGRHNPRTKVSSFRISACSFKSGNPPKSVFRD